MQEISKQEYEELFKWLFGENIEIKEEFDISMASDYYDPKIYYTKQIYDLFQTKAMQRLGKLTHLGCFILENPNIYHTRLEHSKGVYRRCIEFLATQYKNENWRKYIEENKLKGYLVDKIKFMCTHDIGHSMLSHATEQLVGDGNCTHEDIGDKIKQNDEELKQTLANIKANEDESSIGGWLLRTFCDGNLDFDRYDFLSRDSLYIMEKSNTNINELISRLNHSCSLEKLEDGTVTYVYDCNAIKDIESFLNYREMMYETKYRSKENAKIENYLRKILRDIIKSDEESDIKSIMSGIYNKTIDEIDIQKYTDTDDIKLFNYLFRLIRKTDNNDLKGQISCIIPDAENAFNLAVNMLDPKNRKQSYSQDELEFITNVKKLIHSREFKSSNLNDYVLSFESSKDDILKVDFESDAIEKYTKTFKRYNPKEPIYIRNHEGKIVKLENHPDLSIDLSPTNIHGVYIFVKDLENEGYTKTQIDETIQKFKQYDEETLENKKADKCMKIIKTESSLDKSFEKFFEER